MDNQSYKVILSIVIFILAIVTTIGSISLVATLANIYPLAGIIFWLLVIIVDILVVSFIFKINKK